MKRISAILLFLIPLLTFAQEVKKDSLSIESEDIKVGLVLSGGGAKGLAHLGVLEVLEEQGVRIDYIGGTSMGAIIGALYATGYSVAQIKNIFKKTDFNILIQDNLPRSAKTLFEREDSEKYALNLPFDNFKIGLPKGLSRGQNFYNEFSRLTAHVTHIKDFSKLPIPFFCMGTNIETGEQIILDSGYLPRAVAASAALPSIFNPIEVDGKLLTDGGIANNYPITETKNKGAQFIIGVDVQDTLYSKSELKSATDIMVQISNFTPLQQMQEKATKTDIYIKPDMKHISMLDFDEGSTIIANGKNAALDNLDKIKAIAARQLNKKNISAPVAIDSLKISAVNITGNHGYPRSYVLGKLKLKPPAKISYDKLNQGVNNLVGTGNFERIDYRFLPKERGEQQMDIKLDKSENRRFLRFALHYDNLYKTAALINLTQKSLFFKNDVFSLDVVLGDNLRYNLDYYIDKGFYWSIGFKFRFNQFNRPVDYSFAQQDFNLPQLDVNELDLNYSDHTTQVYIETLINQKFSFGVGAEHKRLLITTKTFGQDENKLPRTIFDKSDYLSVFGHLKFDSYDNRYFPKEGFLFDGDFHLYLYSTNFTNAFSEFSLARGKFGYAQKLVPKVSLTTEIEAGAKIGITDLKALNFTLGGFGYKPINNFISFYGYDFISIVENTFIKAGFTIDYNFIKNHHFNISGNFANAGPAIFITDEWIRIPEYNGYAFGYGFDSIAGPLQAKYTYSPELKDHLFFVSLGLWF